ncbi:MAG: hypothetical protein PHG66_03575 [Candidatus Colwellbacteria bacterium]|nr:hypothetical protein [Candidatus Colwellbacteria bacterium]
MFRKCLIFGGISAAFIAVATLSVYLYTRPIEIPKSFTEARGRGADIASAINDFSDQARISLDEIVKSDREGDYTKALDLTIIEIKRTREAKDKAIELLGELQEMASALGEIKAEGPQSIGMQAVSTEVGLVSKLIEYNTDLDNLLNNMRMKFASYQPETFDKETEAITKRMNDIALDINGSSRKYQSLMKEFDERTEAKKIF